MKTPLAFWVAALLLAVRSVALLYLAIVGPATTTQRFIYSSIAIVVLAILALLWFKPRTGRWLAGIYFVFVAWLGLAALARAEDLTWARLPDLLGVVLGCWLAYALLSSKRVKAYVGNKEEPNQPPQRNAGSRPSSDDSPASETPSSLGPRG